MSQLLGETEGNIPAESSVRVGVCLCFSRGNPRRRHLILVDLDL